jgi:hypothetical protein
MTSRTFSRITVGALGSIAVAATFSLMAAAAAPRFYPDDPVWIEPDTEDASAMKPLEISLLVDLTYNMVANRTRTSGAKAGNLNTVGEVPDSSWYTNRAGHRPLTAAEIATGPDVSNGPADGAWTITSSKSDGVTPGFTVKDSTGTRWFLKFDPPGHRAMATGTEVAATKLMWALGYNVPENHIAQLRRDQLNIGKGAKVTLPNGSQRAMRASDIDRLLEKAERDADGSYRVVASKALEGTPIGRIRFEGTRPDDPNDVVAHEDRRELRGYGVFAAWLNHTDAKAINSLDTLVTRPDGRAYVRHHLLDFGSSLGSGGVGPTDYWAGTQYLFEPKMVGKQMVSFGFSRPSWHTAAFYESRSIGRLPKANESFDPEAWKPRVPNAAFLSARADDKFWAAQRLAALSTPLIRAAVETGEFRDHRSEEFLIRALAERRDAILRAYLPALNPIADPTLSSEGALRFRNAAVDADVARAPREYRATWFAFDNATGMTKRLADTTSATTEMAAVKLPTLDGSFVKVELTSIGGPNVSWERPVIAYFTRADGAWRLVGFDRTPNQ